MDKGVRLPAKTIVVQVTVFEAAMLKKLRQYAHGQFTIHKLDGEPRRVVIGGSEMLHEEDALDLELISSPPVAKQAIEGI